jgi:chemotaxis signal transduction protein
MVTMLAAAPDAAPAAPAGPQWVVFSCDDVRLAAPLDCVREILTPRPFTRLPGCGPEVCGLIAVRGRVVTVFDLGVVLGLRQASALADHRLLLVERDGRAVGFAVDVVVTIVHAVTARTTAVSLPLADDEIVGVGDIEQGSFTALDPERLLARLLL